MENILRASEMIGAVKGKDPKTGLFFDDTKHYVDRLEFLTEADRGKVFGENARRVYPRLDRMLKARGA